MMSMAIGKLSVLVMLVGAIALIGCGSDNPAGPSSDLGVMLRGTILNQGPVSNALFSKSAGAQSADDAITVTVQENPAITANVGDDGSFTLRGLPVGTFTLVFKSAGGAVLGMLSFAQVKPNQEITITIEVTASGPVLIEERRNGIGHGDLEIEGLVDREVTVSLAGDSVFVIKGYTVVARPGQTAIREGNRSRTVEDVTEGRRVHVKGVWLPPGGAPASASQQVLAYEIKLQGPAEDDEGEDDGQKITICHKKKNTISISVNAWPAHQAHGDTMGACK